MKLVLVAMLALPRVLQATQCFALPYCARIGTASVFFVGEVIEGHDSGERKFTGDPGPSLVIYEVRFRVVEAFLGTKEGEAVTVFSTGPLTPGTKLFIEAWRDHDGKVRTGFCPEMMASNESMLDFLRRGKQGHGDGASLTVFTQDEHYRSVGATVAIDGPVERTAGEEPKGGFRFADIPAGRYEIDARRPGYAMKYLSDPIDVLPNACAIGIVRIIGAMRISGTVNTAEGMPASGATIHIAKQAASDEQENWVATANEFGRYEVVNLHPGNYTVMAQPRELDFPVYYPGRSAPHEAGTVRLEPERDREINLTFFPENQQTIRFHFVNDEGRPLPLRGVDIFRELNGIERGWRRVLTDEQATWTTTLVQGARYRLTWSAEFQATPPVSASERFVSKMDLTPKETTRDVTVVLRRH